MSENLETELKRLRIENRALLDALPSPGFSASERPITYERLTKVDQQGREITLEWHVGQGWSISVQAG
jgi:hypothetical protein